MTKKFALALVSLMVLALLAVGSASAGVYAKNITTGDTVFIGESGLDISAVLVFPVAGDQPKLAWYSAGSAPATDVPAIVYPINGTEKNFNVEETMFSGYTGSWYSYNGTVGTATYAFQVLEPSLKAAIYNNATTKDITNKKVVADDTVTFRLDTNLYALFARQGNLLKVDTGPAVSEAGNQTAGIDLKVTTPDGATLIALYNQTLAANSILGIQPAQQSVYLIDNDVNVDAWKLTLERYSPGIYSVHAECNVNEMKTNLGAITGKTVSATGTLEMDKDSITITTDKETVIRNNDFSVTLEGRPKTNYYVWFSGTSSFASARNATDVETSDIPPIFTPNQEDVAYLSGNDFLEIFKGTSAINTDLSINTSGAVDWSGHGVNVTTGTDGTIVIGVSTHSNTKATTYTLRAQKWVGGALDLQLYETVKVKVEKGAVTITASGDGSYYLGEQITLSGTNTDSDYVYLFVTGPNLPSTGGDLGAPKTAVTDNVFDATWVRKSVNVDNTWEYKLETAQIGLDAGTYTIYAVNEPRDKDHLSGTKYDTVSIVIKKPFVTATVSASTVAKGDKLYIRGTAEGNPTPGVGIWILGKNYWNGEDTTVVADSRMATETVNDDGSFEYEFGSGETTNLAAGQYFVVVQHPMYNDRFDVDASSVNYPFVVAPAAGTVEVQEGIAGAVSPTSAFIIVGAANKLQGSDAAQALIEMIDSPDIDDTYTKLTFLIEEPWIRINSIGDHYVGDQFTISGTTNLAVDDDLIVDVTSSSFTATKKSQSGEFSGKSETVKVVEGTTYNEWSMDLDASTFKADEYIVNVESIETSATATTTFNVLTGGPTATVTGTATTAVVTTTATATQATPTETAAPGFGALVALIGLGAVAALVLRKE